MQRYQASVGHESFRPIRYNSPSGREWPWRFWTCSVEVSHPCSWRCLEPIGFPNTPWSLSLEVTLAQKGKRSNILPSIWFPIQTVFVYFLDIFLLLSSRWASRLFWKKKLKYKVRKITIHHGESRLFNSEDSSKSHQASPIQYNSSKFTSSSTWQPKKGSSNSLSCRIETPHCQKQNSTCTGRRNTLHFPPHGSNEMESWNILKSVPPHAVRSQITFLLKLYLLHRSFS